MAKAGKGVVQMVGARREEEAIINNILKSKIKIMAENSKGQMPQHENADKKSSGTHVDENVRTSRTASEQGAQPLNEKSSTTGRGTSGRGLSSKDGVTGSDLDGQVTY